MPRRALRFWARTHLPFQKWCVMCRWALQRPDKGQKMTIWSERPPADRLQAHASKQAWQVQKTRLVIGVRAQVLTSLISLTLAAVSACPRGLPGTPTTRWSRAHYLPGWAPNLARDGQSPRGRAQGRVPARQLRGEDAGESQGKVTPGERRAMDGVQIHCGEGTQGPGDRTACPVHIS